MDFDKFIWSSILSSLRREIWKQRQEDKRILEKALAEHQRMVKDKEEENRKFSYKACMAEGCIISSVKRQVLEHGLSWAS